MVYIVDRYALYDKKKKKQATKSCHVDFKQAKSQVAFRQKKSNLLQVQTTLVDIFYALLSSKLVSAKINLFFYSFAT